MDVRYGPPRAIRQTVKPKGEGEPAYKESLIEYWMEHSPTTVNDANQLREMLVASRMGGVVIRASEETEGCMRLSVVVRTREDESRAVAGGKA